MQGMNPTTMLIGATIIGLAIGFFVTFFWNTSQRKKRIEAVESECKQLTGKAEKEADELTSQAKSKAYDLIKEFRDEFDQEVREARKELQRIENRLLSNQDKLDRKAEYIDGKHAELESKQKLLTNAENQLEQREKEHDLLVDQTKQRLEQAAQMSADQAKDELMKLMESEAKHEAAKMIRQIEDRAKDDAEKLANKVVATAIQRYAGEHVQERTVSVVQLPDENMKGRIIGREGRNIRTLESLTGCDLIIDDTPEAVVVSGFNPVRREIARVSLETLIADGRIHPARIEEIVSRTEKEVDKQIKEAGEQATFELGIHNLHPELIKLVGALKFRTSYGQNQHFHAIEVASLAGMLATELGADPKIAKRAGLLHDIGKAMDQQAEGGHAVIGAEFAKKCGEDEVVWHAIGAHHEDYKPKSLQDFVLIAADAISGARPGARRESLDAYIKRLEELERISLGFKGVRKAFAIQAGREVRVLVENKNVTDDEAAMLSRDIAKKIEKDMRYPGQIKVTVIRETRAVEFAR